MLEEDNQGAPEAPVARPAARPGGRVCGTKLSNGDHCVLKPFKQVINALVQCTKDVMSSEASMMHYSECMQTMEESVANNTDLELLVLVGYLPLAPHRVEIHDVLQGVDSPLMQP